MEEIDLLLNNKIAIVIPFYNAKNHIPFVVEKIPNYINQLIIVNDKSKEEIPLTFINEKLNKNTKLVILDNPQNLGVGGATITGFNYLIDKDIDVVVKVDADNQMDLKYLPELIIPLLLGNFEMAKGNRFRNIKELNKMPFIRRFGNLGLSFLTKMATGYWNNFDPTNGYFAIKNEVLNQLEFSKLANRYFFETSLISQLYFVEARIKDVSMPAIYADEKSSMKVWKMPFIFSFKLFKVFIKRIIKTYFLYDFNIASIYILFGVPLFLFGLLFGVYEWIYYSSNNIFAPTGTIMIVTLSVILGFQLLLQAVHFDIVKASKSS